MMEARIPKTGLPRAPQKRSLRQHDRKHLEFIRTLPCIQCWRDDEVVAAHVRKGTDGGMGKKPSDKWTLPLCWLCHRSQHDVGESWFWGLLKIDAHALAERLWKVSGDRDQALRAIGRARQ
jgi:hypothetical protein